MSLVSTVRIVAEIIQILWSPVRQHISYVTNMDENVNTLTRAMEALTSKRKDIERVDEGPSIKRRRLTHQVQNWIKDVAHIEMEVNLITSEIRRRRTVSRGHFADYWSCYQLSKRALKKLKDVKDVNEEGSFDRVFVSPSRSRVVEISGKSTDEQTMGNAMKADINVIETLTKMESGELFYLWSNG